MLLVEISFVCFIYRLKLIEMVLFGVSREKALCSLISFLAPKTFKRQATSNFFIPHRNAQMLFTSKLPGLAGGLILLYD